MSNPQSTIKNIQLRIRIAQREAIKAVDKELAPIIVDYIKDRTRVQGEGLDGSFEPLSEKYIKLRSKAPNLSRETTPDTSNLTATGQLIDAIKSKVSGSKITLSIKNNKRRKELNGRVSGLTNNELRRILEDEVGTRFFGLTEDENRELIDLATQLIKERLKDELGDLLK